MGKAKRRRSHSRNGRKERGPEFKYVKGATWQDVLKGRPVTKGEHDPYKSQQRTGTPTRQRPYRCRDCSRVEQITQRAGVNDRTHRCPACGGILDPVVHHRQTASPSPDSPAPGATT